MAQLIREWFERMTHPPTDSRLLSGTAGLDGPALQSLVEEHGTYLYGIARTLTRNSAEAEDAVQETFLSLMGARFDGRSSIRTFLVSVLVRRAALLRRKRRGWLRIVSDPGDRAGGGDEQGAIDARLDLAALLEQLSPEHREVIVMRELEAMTYDQIAAALGVPRGTVESRLSRAREQLRTMWKK